MLPFDRITTYIDQMKAWYDVRTKSEQVNRTLFQKLQVTLPFTFILICNDLESGNDFKDFVLLPFSK